MLPAGKHVMSFDRLVPSMSNGALIIDCSTIDVESAKQAYLGGKHGMASVDAPVSTAPAARRSDADLLCGGEEKACGRKAGT
jgi:3-hydroxyisobutyrate dehydrogenase